LETVEAGILAFFENSLEVNSSLLFAILFPFSFIFLVSKQRRSYQIYEFDDFNLDIEGDILCFLCQAENIEVLAASAGGSGPGSLGTEGGGGGGACFISTIADESKL
jgi:hypothetical protein